MRQTHYTPEHDVIVVDKGGHKRIVARAGVPMPIAQAIALGLVKPKVRQGPSEVK